MGNINKTTQLVVTMDEDINQKLFDAARVGEYDDVNALIYRAGVRPQWSNSSGKSALHWAAWRGHIPVARLLLDNGWELDRADDKGTTPLNIAAGWDEVSMVQFLASRGAEINTQNISKWTPLHFAAKVGYPAVVRLLLGLGADRSLKNDEDKTAEELCEDEETRAVFTEIPDKGQV